MNESTPATIQAHRQRCEQKKLPCVTIAPVNKLWVVVLDMGYTGATLNAVGTRAVAIMAYRLGSVDTIDSGLRCYSLATAQKVAKQLMNIGKDTRFRAK